VERRNTALHMVTGLALGLFLARVMAESTRLPLPPLGIVALAVTSCVGCVWLVSWFNRRAGQPHGVAPTLVLLIYVFWPQRDATVALTMAAIVLLAWLIDRSSCFTFHVSRLALVDLLTFLITLAVYLATLQKDILPADSGEFQVAITNLGVLHQPGYPLYTLVGKLFTLLPLGSPALGLNLMSAVLAAGTLTSVGAIVRRMVGGRAGIWGGLAAVLVLGTATTFWAQATVANIRMPTAFFTAWCLNLLMAYRQSLVANGISPIADRYLLLFAFAFSLGFGHYFPLAFVGLFFLVFLMLVDPALIRQPRRWRKPLLVFALAQLVWLYLPIHAAIAPTPETSGLTSPGGFLWYALGQGFAGDMLAFAGPEHLPSRLALLPTLFPFQMNLVLLIATLVGAVLLIWRDWRAGLMLIGGFLVHTFIAITYRAPQTVEYEMPAYVLMAVMVGYGVGQILILKSQISNVAVASVIAAGLANGVAHAPSFITLASDRSTREYVEPILRDAPQMAVILADWHFATPMWYLQQVERARPDVEVRYVYPVPGQEISQVWRDLIEENVVTRAVIVTHYWGQQYPALPYTFEPFHQAWLVRAAPRFDMPRDLYPLSIEFDGKLRLVGYQVNPARASPGQPIEVTLALQAIGQLDRNYSLTVHLVDSSGARRTQRDHGYPAQAFTPGEVRVDCFTLPLEPTLAPGHYTVQVGAYFVPPGGGFQHLMTSSGEQMATVAALDLAPSNEPLPTLHPLDVSFASGPILTGVDYDTSTPSSLRVYLHWRGPGPAGDIARVGAAVVTLPALSDGATLVTGIDVPLNTPLRLTTARVGSGAWAWPVDHVSLPDPRGERYVMLSDQMMLVGVESPRRQVAPGQPVDVTLRYLSLKPLVINYVASVRMDGPGETWRVASDDHPAGNAFPTLKWIAGSTVEDGRRLVVPADAQPGRATGYLKVYDEVREEVLPPLDARMGDDIPLGEWNIK